MLETFFSQAHIANIAGIISLVLIGYGASHDRRAINFKTLTRLFVALIATAFFLIKFSFGMTIVTKIAFGFSNLYQIADRGAQFLFGALANSSGAWGFIFAIKVFPIIIFFSALVAVLNHFGILQWFIGGIDRLVRPLLGTQGPETVCAIANSFLGQTEAPFLIRSYLANISESGLFSIMVAGMGTVSGAIMAVYSSLGVSMQHLLIASIMSISSTLFMAKLWFPDEKKKKKSEDKIDFDREVKSGNALDALAQGASEGAMLVINIGAMLIVAISLMGCVDGLLAWIAQFLHTYIANPLVLAYCSLKGIFGILGVPAALMLGVPMNQIFDAGNIIGVKVAVNEMVAYAQLGNYAFDDRIRTLLTYALCGFSNFSSIGIQLGGIGALVPSTRSFIGKYGVRAVMAAACANLLNACIVGLFI